MTARGCLFVLLATAAFAAQAVEFDEKLKAPMAASGAELKSRIEALAVKGGAADAQARVDEVRSQSFARQRFEARWLLGRMIDARKPLPELEALGFVAREDGGYAVDTEEHQEWRPLQNNLLIFADPEIIDSVGAALLARGFEPGDLEVMRNYVRQHDLKRMCSEDQLALLLSAGKMAKKRQKLKLPVDDRFMWSFFYQKASQLEESERRWAAGLLNSLTPHSQRALASYFSEGSGTMTIIPTDDSAAIAYERELLLNPDLEDLAKTAFKEGKL
jgi:hypothetical protein